MIFYKKLFHLQPFSYPHYKMVHFLTSVRNTIYQQDAIVQLLLSPNRER
jgi:hypothetical protein